MFTNRMTWRGGVALLALTLGAGAFVSSGAAGAAGGSGQQPATFAAAPQRAVLSGSAVVTTPALSLDMAERAARAALTRCAAEGQRVVVAVVDRGGLLRVMLRADGSGPHSEDSARRKAFTSASTGTSTADLIGRTDVDSAGIRDIAGFLLVRGGVPVKAAGQVVAGIGVSGSPTGDLDENCAKAGIAAIAGELG